MYKKRCIIIITITSTTISELTQCIGLNVVSACTRDDDENIVYGSKS